MEHLVVGVDGSSESREALAWAAGEARAHGLELRVVHVYPPPDSASPSTRSYAFVTDAALAEHLATDDQRWREQELAAARDHALGLVEELVSEVTADHGDLRATAHVLADDHPARALMSFSANAHGLVVGSRGRGGFAGLLLGSVSQQCVQHARCPVTVVPASSRRG